MNYGKCPLCGWTMIQLKSKVKYPKIVGCTNPRCINYCGDEIY